MRKIKVLHIITRLIVGGAQDLALSIGSELNKDKFDVTFVCGPQDFCEEMPKKWDINVTVLPYLVKEINPLKDFLALINLLSFIKKHKFDIVHTHTSKAGVLGRIAAKLAGVPVILYSPHGSIFHSIYYGPKTIFLLSRIENFVASFTDRIINCADNERRDLLENKIASDDKYITIYPGIRQDKFLRSYDRETKRRELNISNDTVVLGNVARLVSEKGHIFCLESFKIVSDVLPKAVLIFGGEGPLRNAIENKIKELDLNDRVIMIGHRNDIPEIINCLDVVLLTSAWEGAPMAIIEAMLMGKAIIATNVGGVPELIKDGKTGILVSYGDRGVLSEAIIRLAKDRFLAERLGEAARNFAKERFEINTMIRKITNLYNDLISLKIKQ
jgi:glycosyltransferase involved in cell wall biosynthesis